MIRQARTEMGRTSKKTIEEVVKKGLCTGCGTCAGICPVDALEMVIERKKGIYLPVLQEDSCTRCGLCLEACPGHSVDYRQLNLEVFGVEPANTLLGNYRNCYTGYATDYEIRYNSSSGGLVTALLIFALEQGIIDGALVTRMHKDRPMQPAPFIARTKEEIIEASGSKYCPVPVNTALKEIVQSEEGARFAVVGLPCHLHGIRKAEVRDRRLKERIVLHLGIFCNHVPSFHATEALLKKLRVKSDEIARLDYRGEGWPGHMKISRRDGEMLLLPHSWSFLGSYFFIPSRCLMCCDATSELADLSLGDAWLSEVRDDRTGRSVVVSRTQRGSQILEETRSAGATQLTEVSADKLIESQAGVLYLKKSGAARKGLLKPMSHNVQDNSLKPDPADRALALFPYLNHRAGSTAVIRRLLPRLPSRLIWLYRIPYTLLSSRKAKLSFRRFSGSPPTP